MNRRIHSADTAPESSRSLLARGLAPALILGVIVGLSALARGALGIQWSADSAREFVEGLGWWAPGIFVGLVTFRSFLLIPSSILLPVGGFCFGALAGTFYGAAGVIVSGLLVFGAARWAGRDAVLKRASGRLRGFLALSNTGAAAAVVSLVTAYPFGPITALHTGAGLTRMTFGAFAIALTAGAVVRAAAFSFFGSTVAEGDGIWLATGLLLGGMALPLVFPRARAWLRGDLQVGA